MFSISDKVILFIFLVANVSFVVCAGEFRDESIERAVRDRSGMLFAPRLGKRSLRLASENDRQAFFRLLEAADALKFYYEQLPYYESQADEPETKVTKKVIFTPKLGRSIEEQNYDSVDFTPRLGRRVANDAVTPADQDVYRSDPDQMDRSKYFSPRLGRNSVNFSPRLGRELTYDYPEKIRVARSANKTKSS